MKTKLLSLLLITLSIIIYSCSKDDDSAVSAPGNGDQSISQAERRFIISNCSSHAGCHSARLIKHVTMQEAMDALKASHPVHTISVCERDRLHEWITSEAAK